MFSFICIRRPFIVLTVQTSSGGINGPIYIYIYDAIASLYSETFSLVCQNNIHTNWFLFSKGDNASLILSILYAVEIKCDQM